MTDNWKFFTLDEMVASDTAQRKSISNTPTPEIVDNLDRLVVSLLDPIRELWGEPLIISSGFRTQQVNALVGGTPRSYHRYGLAADICTRCNRNMNSRERNWELYKMIKQHICEFPVDMVIAEDISIACACGWVHVQTNKEGCTPRRKPLLAFRK